MEISPIGKMPDLEKLGFDTEVDEDEESEEGGRTSDEEVEVVAIHEHLCIDVEEKEKDSEVAPTPLQKEMPQGSKGHADAATAQAHGMGPCVAKTASVSKGVTGSVETQEKDHQELQPSQFDEIQAIVDSDEEQKDASTKGVFKVGV